MAIFGQSYFPGCLAATVRRSFICHDVIPCLFPEFAFDAAHATRFRSHLILLARSGAHALTASDTSRTTLSDFVANAGIVPMRVDRFPMPSLLHDKAKKLRRSARFDPREPFILYCSTIEARKNHMLLARVWNRALQEGVSLPRLVCAGRWGWGVESLRAYLDANPAVLQNIDFLGGVSDLDLIDLYRSALFGVFPSRFEGWGFGAAECLDFGTPVIVSTAAALQEAVRGLMPVVDPDDEEGWYNEVRRLAESAEARGDLRRAIARGYRPISARASWEAIKSAVLQRR